MNGRTLLSRDGETVLLPDGVFTVRGRDAIEELRWAQAERARATARLVRKVGVAARVGAEGGMRDGADGFSGDEVASALGFSPAVAGRWVEFAGDLVGRLPRVLEAMESGLDESKARVFSEWTRDLSAEHAVAVAEGLLAQAARLPVGALIEAVLSAAVALDPEFAARREARARSRARVVGSVSPDGTASLSGYDLPLEEAVEAKARVEVLADRVRGRGVGMPVGLLRATVYLRLLDGFGAGLDDDALVGALVEALREDPDDGPARNDGPDDGPGPEGGGPDDGPGDPQDGGPQGGDSQDDGPDDSGAGDSGRGEAPVGETPDGTAPEGAAPANGFPDSETGGTGETSDDVAPELGLPAPPTRGGRRGVNEVRVRLSTLLGLDELPGVVVGWGPMLAPAIREWVHTHRHAEWRVVVLDDDGRLLHVLLTRCRPPGARHQTGPGSGRGSGSVGIVEIAVPRRLLSWLDPARFGPWATLLSQLQHRLADLPADGCPDRRPDAVDAEGRRRARAELDRWVRVRDRQCVMATCGRPARMCDLDHTRAWAEHGPSAAWNLGALCRRHHRLKHVGGWTLRQPEPGQFFWRSRAGATYDNPARPLVAVLPSPLPEPPEGRRRLRGQRSYPEERRGFSGGRERARSARPDDPFGRPTTARSTIPTPVAYPDEPPF